MSSKERIELIREIKELLQMDYVSRLASRGCMFDDDTITVMKQKLVKLLKHV